jgi:hypothetical protein
MFIRNRRATLIALSGVILVTTAAIRLPDYSKRKERHVRAVLVPPKGSLPWDADANVGQPNNKKIRVLTRLMETNHEFNPPVAFNMKTSNSNDLCKLYIRTTKESWYIPKKHDGDNPNGFIVGMITNPNDCRTLALPDLGVNDTAAWFVRYIVPKVVAPGEKNGTGRTGLILLQRDGATTKDDWFPKQRSWNLGYCNHSDGGAVDAAHVLADKEKCYMPQKYKHNTDTLSKLMLLGARTRRPEFFRLLPGANDLALWFACGGDCCYSNFQLQVKRHRASRRQTSTRAQVNASTNTSARRR